MEKKKQRPNARTEVRRSRYKVSVDADEGRRRREDNMVVIRKNKREESLLKKRREGLQAHHQLSSSLNNSAAALDNKKLESLPAMVAGVWSDDRNAQLDATTQFRKLLSIERGPPINEVIQSGVVPRFIEFLSRDDFPQLQFEAAWAMTNIASGTSENTRVVIDHGAVPIFVRLLSSPTNDVREQAVRALGNVAGDSPKCRDLVLSNGALMPLLAQFNEHAKLSMLRNATWTLSNFCRGKPQPLFEQTKPALPVLERLIHSNDDEVLTDACWALSYLSDGTNDKIQAVIEAGVCPRLVELLRHPSPSVLIPALRTVGNIVTGDDMQTQGGPDESINVNSNRTSNLPSSMQRPLTAPTVVRVSRPNEVENKRKDLPIVMMEQEIMEAVNDNSAVILCGETGCGKTTQVPQFLYEAGYGSNQCSIRSGTIGVTQPRRVAVLATAKRVAFELGLRLGKEVGFQVRHDKKIGNSCSIKFMTDGILLRELKYDVLLRQYSVIILDEAHERSLNTDILIGMLSRIIQPRQALYEKQQQLLLSGQCIEPKDRVFPLKLILMSATLRVEDFVSGGRLFHNPPIIEVATRQFLVTVHFSKRTEIVDYIGQAYKKVMSIHKRLPQGGILVFVTGQREVEYLCRKLRKASKELVANSSNGNKWNEIISDTEPGTTEDVSMKEINEAFEIHGNSTDHQTDRFSSYDEDQFDIDDDESIASYDSETESETEILGEDEKSVDQKTPKDGGDHVDVLRENRSLASLKVAFEALSGKNASVSISQIKPSTGATLDRCTELPSTATPEQCAELSCPNAENMGDNKRPCAGALCVLPLYAMLPAAAQLCVFEDVKEGERLVVVATNVAETSLTIPGIKYVVDTGREKVKRYNSANGIESYEIQWISKASAAQRAGRAGRTAPGHCYRLYSSAVFNNILPDFSCAEISKVPVDGVVLLMKSMHIDKVANFPFPTPPEANALVEAELCLKALEALDSNGRLTTLGKAMAHYPMSPRHSRMLLTLIQIMELRSYNRANLVLGYAVAAAAALSLSNPFVLQLEGTQTNSDDLEHERSNTLDGEDDVRRKEKLRKKKLKEVAKVSYAKFSNPSSDVLTIAYALQCFELSKSPVEFCNGYGLHFKTMEEMSKLRKQLLHLVFNQNVNSHQGFSWTHGTLDDVEHSWRISSSKNILLQNEEELLCRAICAGWADRVAKRIRAKSGSLAGDRKVNAFRYQASMVKEDVFLHRRSSVANSAPEFLVYSELLHTKRPYMHGATRVKADWLVEYARSLCHFSKSVEGSKYNYDCHKDQVLHWVSPIFGPHQWELPLHSLPFSRDDDQRVAVFACALLEGRVLPCLRYVQKFLAAHPSSILKTQESGQRRVGKLLNKLKTKSIDSCTMLKAAWQENPRALHSEILEWFQKGFHSKFEELWSKMLAEVHLESRQRFPKKQ